MLSLVIPAYNEAARIGSSLETVRDYLAGRPGPSEVLVVDDGSRDATIEVVRTYVPSFERAGVPLRIVENGRNRGKGFTVRHGFLEARGDVVLFSDADLSTPITEMDKLLAPIVAEECDVAFGSRDLRDSEIGRHQPWLRETAGRSFNLFMKIVTGLPFADTQCGFKAFRRGLLEPVFRAQTVFGFGFDVEILYLARKRGARLREVPVIWNDVAGSKVSFSRGIQAFLDVLAIRLRDVRGGYRAAMDPPLLQTNGTR